MRETGIRKALIAWQEADKHREADPKYWPPTGIEEDAFRAGFAAALAAVRAHGEATVESGLTTGSDKFVLLGAAILEAVAMVEEGDWAPEPTPAPVGRGVGVSS